MSWALRREIVETARQTVASGLTRGTSGNVSARSASGFVITPTGMACDAVTVSDLVAVADDGSVAPRQRKPSSEWRIHRDIYAARPEAGAVVHVHPPFATTIAALRRDLPAVHYMIAAAGGPTVRCAAYATFGSAELSANTMTSLEGRNACLLANHGLVALGASLPAALRVAQEVEGVAEIYWRSLCAGTPVILDDAEMERVTELFRSYGQPAVMEPIRLRQHKR